METSSAPSTRRETAGSHRLPALLLAAWILLQVLAFGVWVARTQRILVDGDGPWYQLYALDLYHTIAGQTRVPGVSLPTGIAGAAHALALRSNHPALYVLQISASFALLGPTLRAALWTSAPYLVLLLAGVYLLGAKLADRWTGLVAAFFAGCYPGILGLARSSEEYHPVAALVPWLLLLLLATDFFRRSLASIALGVASGAAVLIKGQVLFFVGVPYLVWAARGTAPALRKGQWRGAAKVLANFSLAIAALLAVSAPWWMPNFGFLSGSLLKHVLPRDFTGFVAAKGFGLPMAEPTAPWTYPWAAKYARVAWTELTPWFSVLFLGAAALAIARRTRNAALPGLLVACPYLLLTLMSGYHHPRYYFPAFTGMALLSAMGWREVPWRAARGAAIAASAAFYALLVFPRSVGPDLFPGVVNRMEEDTAAFTTPLASRDAEDAAAIEAAIASGGETGDRFVEWLMPARFEPGASENLEYTFLLTARRPGWIFDHALPTRAPTEPLNHDFLRARIDTRLLWDDSSPDLAGEAARFVVHDGEPLALRPDGSVVPLPDAWEPEWRARVAGMRFAGAAFLARTRAVVWVFVRSGDARGGAASPDRPAGRDPAS